MQTFKTVLSIFPFKAGYVLANETSAVHMFNISRRFALNSKEHKIVNKIFKILIIK